jgi:hypothetical protein
MNWKTESQTDRDQWGARKYDGMGLGLPISKQLAELHGGTPTLESKLYEGTVAIIALPASRCVKRFNFGLSLAPTTVVLERFKTTYSRRTFFDRTGNGTGISGKVARATHRRSSSTSATVT